MNIEVKKRGNMPIANLRGEDHQEAGLLQKCRFGDAEACNTLLERYNRKIFNTAFRILGEHASAEDALQETLLNVYRGLVNFRGDAQVSTWISRITVNVCLGMMRKGRARRAVSLEDDIARLLPALATPYSDPEKHAITAELQDMVARTFGRMSRKHREVVRLHDLEGRTIPEIARLIHCPVGTVKSRLFYGRQEFKELFAPVKKGRSATRAQTVH